jgi:hypothetical protein
MNIKLVKLLASVCAVLLLIIFVEWVYAVLSYKKLLASTAGAATKKPPVEMPSIELTKQPEEFYDQMVARPLFVKGRRPVDEPKTVDAQDQSVATVFDWELNGVYTKNNSLKALFSRSKTKVQKDNFRKVALDGDLDGWKLMEIDKDKVVLVQGDNRKVLQLRKDKPKVLPKPPVQGQAGRNAPPPPEPEQSPEPIEEPEPIPDPDLPLDLLESDVNEPPFE